MSRARRAAAVTVLAMFAAAAFWPAPRVDVSPLFERPARPPHPSSIYTPPGSHR